MKFSDKMLSWPQIPGKITFPAYLAIYYQKIHVSFVFIMVKTRYNISSAEYFDIRFDNSRHPLTDLKFRGG